MVTRQRLRGHDVLSTEGSRRYGISAVKDPGTGESFQVETQRTRCLLQREVQGKCVVSTERSRRTIQEDVQWTYMVASPVRGTENIVASPGRAVGYMVISAGRMSAKVISVLNETAPLLESVVYGKWQSLSTDVLHVECGRTLDLRQQC